MSYQSYNLNAFDSKVIILLCFFTFTDMADENVSQRKLAFKKRLPPSPCASISKQMKTLSGNNYSSKRGKTTAFTKSTSFIKSTIINKENMKTKLVKTVSLPVVPVKRSTRTKRHTQRGAALAAARKPLQRSKSLNPANPPPHHHGLSDVDVDIDGDDAAAADRNNGGGRWGSHCWCQWQWQQLSQPAAPARPVRYVWTSCYKNKTFDLEP